MAKHIIKNITFFSEDAMGYCLELNKYIETPEESIQCQNDLEELRKRHFQLLHSQKGYNYRLNQLKLI